MKTPALIRTVSLVCGLSTFAQSSPELPQSSPPAQIKTPSTSVSGWTIEETMKVRMVGHVRIAPGEGRVLYTVRTAILDGDKGRYLTQIFTANADGTNERALTGVDCSATHPEWSPDGRWIAFAADRSGRGEGNTLWLIPSEGGEPRAIDVGGTDVSTLKWSPDGKRLAFTMPAPLTAAQAEARAHPEAPQVVDADNRNIQLWVIDLARDGTAPGPARALTPDTLCVRTNLDFGLPYDWSPDGSALAFGHGRNMWRDWPGTGISIVNARTGKTRSLVPSGAMTPSYSPDGRQIAYLGSTARHAAHSLDVYIINTASDATRRLAETSDRHPALVGWSSDGTRVYLHEARRTFTRLISLPVSGTPPEDIDAGDAVLGDVVLDPTRRIVGFTRQTLSRPMEAHISPIARFAPARVSRVNAALPSHPLPRTERVSWKSSDGSEIEGLLTYPVGYEPGQRYPTLVAIRSGGVGFQQAFIANPFQENLVDYYPVTELALRGFAVLQCNSRGGVLPGYGPDYAFPWELSKGKAHHDVMAGVDFAIRIGVTDNARIAISGISYGGSVVSWIITQSRRFKAAIINAGCPDLIARATTAPWVSHDLGAQPWDDVGRYLEHSPLLYLRAAVTPTLILHGDRDQNVFISQAHGLYRALQQRGVDTQMVVYPGEGHTANAPKHLIDIGRRHVEWMTKYLK